MKKVIFIIIGMSCAPYFALASVRVNEIAWMGTSVSANNEWIELYNDGDASADLSGFTLFAEGVKKLSIPLSGIVAPKSFFLLERTNDDAVPGIVADQIYTGALGNSGEILILKDGSGAEVQKIDASAGWQAGDNTTKDTMQWSDGAWITAAPTPKAENFSTVFISETKRNEKALSNMQIVLARATEEVEKIQKQLPKPALVPPKFSAPSIPVAPKRNIASYQYATAVDLVKETGKQSTSSPQDTEEKPRIITLKRPEEPKGFFATLWHFFF